MAEEKNYDLANLGKKSQLKTELNLGIASLQNAEESQFQPHFCLNGEEGMETLRVISQDPENANTEIWFSDSLSVSGDDAWLNIHFKVFLNRICWPAGAVDLSPR